MTLDLHQPGFHGTAPASADINPFSAVPPGVLGVRSEPTKKRDSVFASTLSIKIERDEADLGFVV